jgi:hypothetical protein
VDSDMDDRSDEGFGFSEQLDFSQGSASPLRRSPSSAAAPPAARPVLQRRDRGRAKNTPNWSVTEISTLLDFVDEVSPKGKSGWQLVAVKLEAAGYAREPDAIKVHTRTSLLVLIV